MCEVKSDPALDASLTVMAAWEAGRGGCDPGTTTDRAGSSGVSGDPDGGAVFCGSVGTGRAEGSSFFFARLWDRRLVHGAAVKVAYLVLFSLSIAAALFSFLSLRSMR